MPLCISSLPTYGHLPIVLEVGHGGILYFFVYKLNSEELYFGDSSFLKLSNQLAAFSTACTNVRKTKAKPKLNSVTTCISQGGSKTGFFYKPQQTTKCPPSSVKALMSKVCQSPYYVPLPQAPLS